MKNTNPSFLKNCSEVRGIDTIQNKSMTHPEISQLQEQSFGQSAAITGESCKAQLRIPLVADMLQVYFSLVENTGQKKVPVEFPVYSLLHGTFQPQDFSLL